MQRQSLGGSPSSRLPHPPLPSPSSCSSSCKASNSLAIPHDEEDDSNKKTTKPASSSSSSSKLHRFSISSSSPPSPSSPPLQKFVHVIPILTLLCFLVLYLFSHPPSPSDLAEFKGLKRAPKLTDTYDHVVEAGRLSDAYRGDVLAIRSWRNLQEIERRSSPAANNKSRINRKFADF